ncbi:hypothetical protein ACQKP5_02600 [Pseudomonas vancouverensis]|uniref:hypothetical protein n=1 Tax=Pseudomonas vancouverensis TaxID=95300 RepID=UPI003D068B73
MGMFDPFQMWRDALDLIEGEINSLASRKMESAEFAQAAQQFSRVSIGVQHVVERSLASVLRRLDLPSRAELDTVASALQRVEDKLDQLLPSSLNSSPAPRPSRSRRPAVPRGNAQGTTTAVKRVLKPAGKRAPKEE